MNINKYSASRLFWGFIFILLGLAILYTGSIGWVTDTDSMYKDPRAQLNLNEYKNVIGGIFLMVGAFFTFRAFTKP